MSNYPLKVNKYNWRSLEPQTNLCYTEDYIADHYDLYLTSEYIPDDNGNHRRYYRLHANRAHSIEMALAYDVKCPSCGRNEFVEMVTKKSRAEVDRSLRDGKRELEQSQARISKLDEIIQRLYEDNIEGKISDERFAKMSKNYEAEQKTLECRVTELRGRIASQQESSVNVDRFLALVRKYTDITELTPEIIREFVERIEIFKPEQINGHKVQKMRIVWNCIGEFMPPQPRKDEKTA